MRSACLGWWGGKRCDAILETGDRCARCQRIHEHVTQPRDCTLEVGAVGVRVPRLLGLRNRLWELFCEEQEAPS